MPSMQKGIPLVLPRDGGSLPMGANQDAIDAMNERSVWPMREIAS